MTGNQKKYLVSGIPTVSLNCRSVGRRTMTRPRPSFLSHTQPEASVAIFESRSLRLQVSGILRSLSLRIVLAPRVTETHTPTEDIQSKLALQKKGVAATSHLKTTPPPFFFFFFAFFEKKVGRSGYRKQDISSGWPYLESITTNSDDH